MSDIDAFIATIRENREDFEWMYENSDTLYNQIQQHLRPHHIQQAFTALTLVAQHFLHMPHPERWADLFERALMDLMLVGDEPRQQQAYYYVGHFYMAGKKPQAATVAFEKATQYARREHERVEACIGLLKALSLQSVATAGEQAWAFLLRYAHDCNTPYVRGLIYETAAQMHLSRENAPQAMGYAQTAYVTWQQHLRHSGVPTHDDHRHLGAAAFVMGVSARMVQQFDLAQRYLDRAAGHLGTLPQKQDLRMIGYERGVLHAMQGRHEQALADFQYAHDFFVEQDHPTFAALAGYGKGMNLTKLGRYAEAERALLDVYYAWKDMNHLPNRANAEHALAYLFLAQQDAMLAENWLEKAYATADEIPDERVRNGLLARMQEERDKLDGLLGQGV